MWTSKAKVTWRQIRTVTRPSLDKSSKELDSAATGLSMEAAETFCRELTFREQKYGRIPDGYTFTAQVEGFSPGLWSIQSVRELKDSGFRLVLVKNHGLWVVLPSPLKE